MSKFKDVPSMVNSNALEQAVLAYWEKEQVFAQTLEQTKNGPLFTFYDGPPYATGKPHYGHILQSAIKDTVLRYKTMQGYCVPRRVGWDCHGLPVETLVEKELGLKNKRDIEQFGIEAFNAKCREVVFRYIDEFTRTLRRVGRWADYEHGYATLDAPYMESEWWVFRQLWDLGLVYKAFRSTPYCVRCATPLSNHEVSMSYKDKTDETVYVLLKVSPTSLKLRGANEQYLLIWTTTPWTLPGNSGVAVNPAIEYVSVEHEGKEIVVAKARVAKLFGEDAKITKRWKSDELVGLTYEPLYSFTPTDKNLIVGSADGAWRVVVADYVTAEDGTGLVHIAPAFGEEDAAVGKAEQLPVFKTVDTLGKYVEGVPLVAGEHIFKAGSRLTEDLQKRGLLFKQESFTHSYPFCWRCDTPLIYYALDTWFVKVEALKERMLTINEQINWIPKHVKHGRFAKGVESAPDWAVSRNRFWSVPVPIWECEACGERVCIGSVAELKERSGAADIPDLHRPYVDEIAWKCGGPKGRTSAEALAKEDGEKCKGTLRRVPEVLDVWFDSGSMPYAQWHYPLENKELVEKGFPADFIGESIEMTRAWFYVLHVVATALTTKDLGLGMDKPAFKNVIGSGIIFAEDGQKLSKKLKNYPEIEPTLERFGADVLRFYLLSSTALGEPYRFSEKDMRQVQRNVYMTLWNVFSFFVRYSGVYQWSPKIVASKNMLDKWIIARFKQLQLTVISHCEAYELDAAVRAFIPFIDDLSNWYIRRSRVRFQPSSNTSLEEREGALSTLYFVLSELTKLLAPFMPFVTEEMHRTLTQKDASVHLENLPAASGMGALTKEEEGILTQMETARAVVAEVLALRAKAKIKVRQPLRSVVVEGQEVTLDVAALIQDEVNVKEVKTVSTLPSEAEGFLHSVPESSLRVALGTTLTPELRQEGVARELIRYGQTLRKEAGYALNDRIQLKISSQAPLLVETLASQREVIFKALQADDLLAELDAVDVEKEVTIESAVVSIAVKKQK